MAMNQTQKKYAMQRVNEVLMCKAKKIREGMPKKPVEKQLTYKQAVKLIREGKVKLHADTPPNKAMYNCRYITDMFDFSAHCTRQSNGSDYDTAAAKKIAPLENECQRIKDQLMLGDATEALEMIAAFEKM
jgi:hypothetical protein